MAQTIQKDIVKCVEIAIATAVVSAQGVMAAVIGIVISL